jgi:predicted MFS family arabinose efflux permease
MVTTTPPVYCRVVVQYVENARGLALAIVASGAALAVAVGGPLLNDFVADHGWRAGYVALAIFTAVIGLAALLLLPKERKKAAPAAVKPQIKPHGYGKIFRSPAFWLLVAGNVLTTPPQAIMATQLSLVLAENGAIGKGASLMIGLFAGGMLAGRFIGGFALDRFSAPIVAAIGFALSAVGLFLFASHWDARIVLMLAALLFGLTSGAENDVVAYLIVRNFGVGVYSSVHGIMAATTGVGSILGILLNTILLAQFDNFRPFLIVAGILSIVGGLLFLLLPRDPTPLNLNESAPARGDASQLPAGA